MRRLNRTRMQLLMFDYCSFRRSAASVELIAPLTVFELGLDVYPSPLSQQTCSLLTYVYARQLSCSSQRL